MIVRLEEMFGHKQTHFGTVKKSLCQSYVHVALTPEGELADKESKDNRWKHAGYYMHAASTVVGLVDFPLELGEALAEAIGKQLKKKVHWGSAPQSEPEEELIDEFDGETEDTDVSE